MITEPGDITKEELGNLEDSSEELGDLDSEEESENPPNMNTEENNTMERLLSQLALQNSQRSDLDLITLVNQLIPDQYNGNISGKYKFIEQCNILKDRGTTQSERNLLFNCVKNKLTGRAYNCIPTDANSIDNIITALETNIKADSIEAIGRNLDSLKLTNMSNDKFRENLRKYISDLERCYIALGVTDESTKVIIQEKAVSILMKQIPDLAAQSMLMSAQITCKTVDSIIDFFFNRIINNTAQVMNVRQNFPNKSFNGNMQNNRNFRNNNNRGYNYNRGYNNSRGYNNNFGNNNNRGNYLNNNNRGYNNNFGNNNYHNNNRSPNNYNRNLNRGGSNQRSHNQNNYRNHNHDFINSNNNTRNIHPINSENYQTLQSHGDLDGY